MRNKNKTRRAKRGGGATVMPLKYYDPTAQEPDAAAGHNLLKVVPPMLVRPKIGGSRSKRSSKRVRGGFVPSVMEGFVAAASKYIVPLALFAGYKLMTKKGKRGSRHRHTRRR